MTLVAILGAHPDLSWAELTAVLERRGLPVTLQQRSGAVAVFDIEGACDAGELMRELGGTIKLVELLGVFREDKLVDWLFDQIDRSTKFHFGFSLYPLESGATLQGDWKTIQRLGLSLKRVLKQAGISARFVQSKEIVLSSLIVHKERLLKNGTEVVLLKKADGTLLVGHTLAAQAYGAFAKRDYGRPAVDAKSGMLPPKLARMMVNLAQLPAGGVLLDPFCGSGTVLQEAWDIGYRHVIGSDISAKAIADTQTNLEWLGASGVPLTVCEAQQIIEQRVVAPGSVDAIVFEGYLGPPTPNPNRQRGVEDELIALYEAAFPVLESALKPGGVIVAALPFWSFPTDTVYLPLKQLLAKTHLKQTHEPLLYRRPQATVGRQILRLKNA